MLPCPSFANKVGPFYDTNIGNMDLNIGPYQNLPDVVFGYVQGGLTAGTFESFQSEH